MQKKSRVFTLFYYNNEDVIETPKYVLSPDVLGQNVLGIPLLDKLLKLRKVALEFHS